MGPREATVELITPTISPPLDAAHENTRLRKLMRQRSGEESAVSTLRPEGHPASEPDDLREFIRIASARPLTPELLDEGVVKALADGQRARLASHLASRPPKSLMAIGDC
jgi:hypothetical protein